MRSKKLWAVALSGAMAASMLAACGGSSSTSTTAAASSAAAAQGETKAAAADAQSGAAGSSNAEVTVRVAYENSESEPLGKAWEDAKQIITDKSGGTMAIETYPDSQLGDKSSLIDSMLMGENVVTLADGAFYADYGKKDMGILFGPFLFDNWDQCWKLIDSDWYKDQCKQLESQGLHIIASNWKYGERDILTKQPVHTVDDLKGMKIRVPSNEIQSKGFDVLGATSTGMALNDVYQALQTGTIDGAENPVATLYGRKLHEVAPYLILDGHVLNFTTWVCSNDWYQGLTPDQQQWLTETCEEAGEKNNDYVDSSSEDYLQKMKDEGVTVYEPTDSDLQTFKDKAQAFYDLGSDFGWSDGLYDTVKKAMGD